MFDFLNTIKPWVRVTIGVSSLTFSLLLSSLYAEGAITPTHFSYSATLTDSGNSLRELLLPQHVMQHTQRSDLGDLRVVNADGQFVPHEFKQQTPFFLSSEKTLTYYPFDQQQATDPANIRIQVMQHTGKQSITIDSSNSQKKAEDFWQAAKRNETDGKKNEYQYIIENAERHQPLCSLNLNWQQQQKSLIIPLTLETSNDLQNWSSLLRSSSISRLDYEGSQLVHPQLKFSCTTQKFLRLTWQKPEQNIVLQSILGTYKQTGNTPIQTFNLGKPEQLYNSIWLFKVNNLASMNQLSFTAPDTGLLYKGRLYSRQNDDDEWHFRNTFTQYRLKVGSAVLESSPIHISSNGHTHWKVELAKGMQFSDNQLPDIITHWQQQKLVFLAQGKAPFSLVYGSPDVSKTHGNSIGQLIQTLESSGEKPDRVTMNNPVKNTDVLIKEKAPPWGLITFWLLLLLGTVILGYMAYSLYRQMNSVSHK